MDYSVIAFLDILGFSNMVEADSASHAPAFLPTFLEVFAEVQKLPTASEVSLRMFSDSVIISASLSANNVATVIETSGELQRRFLKRRILLRGGIAFGKHFEDGSVTFSQALISAYQIETKLARFPRVVIDENALNYAWHDATANEELRARISSAILRDRDGAAFVHYLIDDSVEELAPHIQANIKALTKPAETVLEKARWLLDYLNHRARKMGLDELIVDELAEGFRSVENLN